MALNWAANKISFFSISSNNSIIVNMQQTGLKKANRSVSVSVNTYFRVNTFHCTSGTEKATWFMLPCAVLNSPLKYTKQHNTT
jgi:hypothetical protein